jgi:hypothetical protein
MGGDWEPYLISISILIITGTIGIVTGTIRRRRSLASYRITLEGQSITRSQEGVRDQIIDQDEVTDIAEAAGGILIRAENPHREIHVPSGLDGYDELKALLSRLREIRSFSTRPAYWSIIQLFGLLTLLLTGFLATIYFDSPYVVVPSGSLVIVILLVCVWMIQRSPHVDARTRTLSWLVFLPLLSIVFKLLFALGLLSSGE